MRRSPQEAIELTRPALGPRGQARRELLRGIEARILALGILLTLLMVVALSIGWLVDPELAARFAAMTGLNLTVGRAAGMSFGYASGLHHPAVITSSVLIETIQVLVIYPLFVLSWKSLVDARHMQRLLVGMRRSAEAIKSWVARYGMVGLFAFVFLPFWMTGPVVGSVMAPEQASGEGVDGRSDIYALGIILFEMLTGRQPYEADTPMGVAIKHITDPVPHIQSANPNLPAGMEAVIQKAMAKSRNDRYPTAVDMANALRDVIRSTSTQMQTRVTPAVPQTVVSKKAKAAAPPAKKTLNPLVVILPILAVVMLGAGGFFILNGLNAPDATNTPAAPATFTSAPAATATTAPTDTPTEPAAVTPTAALPTQTEPPTAPRLPVLGDADKIAFVANNEIWMMNVNGSELKQLTTDGATKNDLQWVDRDMLLFLSGKTVKYYRMSTDSVETLTSFPSAVSLEAFQVSHGGEQVVISLSNEVFVVPFDIEVLKGSSSPGRMSHQFMAPSEA